MARVPELFIPEQDQLARVEGSVYIADLMASHVLSSLKQNCAPQGLGFIHARPVTSEEVNALHQTMGEALNSSEAELQRGLWIGDIAVRSDYEDSSVVEFSLDYWDGRPMKTTLRTSPDTDKDMLTGFQPFNPWGFDRDQGAGVAQRIIDALRDTGDFKSFDVESLEGGRTFDRAKETKDLSLGLLLEAINGRENPQLGERLAASLEQYDKGFEQ